MIMINRKARPFVPIADYQDFLGLADYMLKNPRSSISLGLKGVFISQTFFEVITYKGLNRTTCSKNQENILNLPNLKVVYMKEFDDESMTPPPPPSLNAVQKKWLLSLKSNHYP